jgi:1-acyl-sn-glycerol-3-phosphate acyltransferase
MPRSEGHLDLAAAAPVKAAAPPGPLESVAQSLVCGLLYGVSKTITHVLNTTRVLHGERFLAAYESRVAGQGLITASNHVTAVDDPGAIAPLVPARWLLTPDKLRYTLCATDRCFRNSVTSAILGAGRVLPVQRGLGPQQPFMDAVVAHLNRGAWVHMFPEGARRYPQQPAGGSPAADAASIASGDGGRGSGAGLGPVRAGIGRLIVDAAVTPVVLPIFHRGLHRVMHRGHVLPLSEVGAHIDVVVGEPISGLPALIAEMRCVGKEGGGGWVGGFVYPPPLGLGCTTSLSLLLLLLLAAGHITPQKGTYTLRLQSASGRPSLRSR